MSREIQVKELSTSVQTILSFKDLKNKELKKEEEEKRESSGNEGIEVVKKK